MNLDELERQVLGQARGELTPSPQDRARHQSALVAAGALVSPVASGPAAPEPLTLIQGLGQHQPSGLAPAALSGWLRQRGGAALTIGLLVGGALGFGAGWYLQDHQPQRAAGFAETLPSNGRASDPALVNPRAASATPDVIGAPTALEGEVQASSNSAVAAAAPAVQAEKTELEPTARQHPARVRSEPPAAAARNSRQPSASAPTSTGERSTLAAELAMLQRARRALGHDNGRLALGIVHSLDEQFPSGMLLEERAATRILSLCKLGRNAEAKAHTLRFVERYPGSVYAERVGNSCASEP